MSEKRNVPSLRFPNFSELWSEKKLGKITAKVGSGKTPRGGEQIYTSEGVPFIRSQNVLDSRLVLDGVCIPENIHEEMAGSKVLPRDILLNITGGSIGRSCVTPDDFKEGNVNQHVCIIRLKNDSPSFLQAILSSYRGQKLIFEGQTGSGREGLNFESIKSFKIFFPSLSEQQKIAEFLTAVDRRIELLQAKKEKLEAYKKGVMQKIFSQQFRFKADDGSEFPDWEERKLGEVLDYEQPTKYLVSSTEYNDSYPTPVLTAGKTFLLGYTDETTGIFTENLPTIIFDDFTTAFQYVDFPFKAKSSAMKMLVPREPSVIMKYVYEAMLQIKFVPGDHKRHWISEFQEFEIPYPSEAEQKKIVQFLTSMDSTINNLNQQITQTQTWKKGLLQKMFV
ncbi:restriction endonuclease subunit S [Algoriphagus formosus]|uniref:Restriction endonuclease subunit S n=1 Tax=Algoriphagus formosus TaxID=2007308 RepID=A0A4R5UWG1_9BACT|nr:restriction endonuclease subunit S [Algoriphagus aquimaris]TDK43481.1 restriction endonuclease subunit S [Algoriphagus aquimaris]